MLDVITGFIHQLRSAGLPVSLTESVDALEAVRHVPLHDRGSLRCALRATLVKNQAHLAAFDALFAVYFSPRGLADAEAGGDASAVPLSAEELVSRVEQVLAGGDEDAVRALARQAVSRFAGMEEGRPLSGRYYQYRTLRHLDVAGALDRLLRSSGGGGDGDGLEERLVAEDYRSRAERLRSEVEEEIRRRLVSARGPEALAGSLRAPLPEEVDFMHASAAELAALRRALRPLARKLASRLARRRRNRHRGSLHFRHTVRRSLSSGGVPADLAFRRPHPSKPEIVVIADVSGSVASFSRFTLQLVHAISWQFSRVRSFVFIDGIDEVTPFFQATDDVSEALRRVSTEADVVWMDGHSHYGHALETFWHRWGREITPKTTVIVLGDARSNYHPAEAWVMGEIRARARRVYWLNPEPRSYWNTGDSVLDQYAVHCDGAFECRNLKQLADVVEHL